MDANTLGVWAVWALSALLWALGTYAAIGFALTAGDK